MEESNTTITDSTTNRTIFFTVESRSIQNLVDMIENKVSKIILCILLKSTLKREKPYVFQMRHFFFFFGVQILSIDLVNRNINFFFVGM